MIMTNFLLVLRYDSDEWNDEIPWEIEVSLGPHLSGFGILLLFIEFIKVRSVIERIIIRKLHTCKADKIPMAARVGHAQPRSRILRSTLVSS